MKKVLLSIAALSASFAIGYSAHNTGKIEIPSTDSVDYYGVSINNIHQAIIDAETAYCREIDSLCYAHNAEIDADAYDIMSSSSMEEAACKILGEAFFYRWRYKESKTAWEYDVLIARYCY